MKWLALFSRKRFVSRASLWGVFLTFLSLQTLCFGAKTRIDPTASYNEFWDQGEYGEALRVLDIIIGGHQYPPPVKWLTDRAELYWEVGRGDEAIAALEALQFRFPSPGSTLKLALMYRERGRKEDFTRTLQQASERIDRTMRYVISADLLLTRGRIAELQGGNPKAILNSLYADLMKRASDYAPGFVAAGDLALRKWDYQLAAEYYEKALKIDGESQAALAGLAECYWKSSDPRLEECVKRLVALNPKHATPQALAIEMALDLGRTDEAAQLVDEALSVNPNRMRTLGLQSALYFLTDNPTSMAQVQKRALELNPTGSEVFRVPGRIASRHYRFHDAVGLQQSALALDPSDYRARALYAFDLLRLGEEKKGREQLDLAFKADRYNVTVFNMLNLLDSLARFESIERGPFLLQMPKSEAPLLADDALALLEEAYALYTKKYGIELAKPIRVQIFDNHDDFMVRSVGLPGSVGHLGICFGQLVTMDSPSARPKWEANWKSVLWHEFTHVITLQKTNYRMPRWLSEGISVYEETLKEPSWGQRLNVAYKGIVENEPLPGVADLETYFTTPKSAAHLMFGYLTAGEFARFYVERYGFDALKKTLERIGAGEITVAALVKSTGGSRQDLDSAFKAFLEKRFAPYGNLPSGQTPNDPKLGVYAKGSSVTLAQESWATSTSLFADAMRLAQQNLRGEKWNEAEAALKRAHDFFPDYMGADAPLRQLIALYQARGRWTDLLEALRRQVACNSTDFPSCRKLTELLAEDGAWGEMTRVAERALSVDPFDVSMRRRALEGYARMGDHARALATLDKMILLDPSWSIDYRMRRIETLCAMEEWPEAKRETVLLLEETPHFRDAQEALLRIVDRDSEKASEAGVGRKRRRVKEK